MKRHLLQSREWGKFERMLGGEVIELSGGVSGGGADAGSGNSNGAKGENGEIAKAGAEEWAAQVVVEKTALGKYWFIKYGPSLAGKAAAEGAFREISERAKREGAIFVRVEPILRFEPEEMAKIGRKIGVKIKKVRNIDPEHTWVLDLRQSEEEILGGMEKSTVKFWRNAAKKGIEVRKTREPEEIGVLMPILQGVAEKRHFNPEEDAERLKKQMEAGFATLYIAELEGEEQGTTEGAGGAEVGREAGKSSSVGIQAGGEGPEAKKGQKRVIAASLVYDVDKVRYTVHSGADYEYRKLRPGLVLSVEKILDAKRAGMEKYDFWGITTSTDPKHPWYGFTQHKKSFGGEEVDYAGTYDMIIRPGKYRIYEILRFLNRKMRKLAKK